MMILHRIVFGIVWLGFSLQMANAQSPMAYWEKDIPKSTDSPLVARPTGAVIAAYSSKAFDESKVLVGTLGSVSESFAKGWTAQNTAILSGKTTNIIYRHPKDQSPTANYERQRAALQQQGYTLRFECRGAACAPLNNPSRGEYNFVSALGVWMPSTLGSNFTAIIGANNKGGLFYGVLEKGVNTITLLCIDRDTWALAPYSWYQIIEGTAMETGKIKVPNAVEMSSSMKAIGKQILYGIFFDTNQATVKPESKPTLVEIATLLKTSPQLRLIVAGHTDNVGEFGYNVTLSERRSAAVIQALTSEHGVAAARLVPFGAGMAGPIASNADEAGRAKNRRVELVAR